MQVKDETQIETQIRLNVYIEALEEAEMRLHDAQAACAVLKQIARELYHQWDR